MGYSSSSVAAQGRPRSLFIFHLGLAIVLVATSCTTAVPPQVISTPRAAATLIVPPSAVPLGPFLPSTIRVPTLTTFPTPTKIATRIPSTPGATSTPAESSIPIMGQHLAFVTNVHGNDEIYIRSVDSPGGMDRLTFHPGRDESPSFSPDGSWVAYASDRDGDFDIYVSHWDGRGFVRLIDSAFDDRDPAWSPDGRRIAFRSNRDGNNDIYVYEVAGERIVRLTNLPADDLVPAWSPDGGRLTFMSARDGNLEIYIMNADGSDPLRVTCSLEVDGYPSWSPDGKEVAFHSKRVGTYDIYRIAVAPYSEPCPQDSAVPLTTHEADDMTPVWDGEWIWLMSAREEQFGFGVFRVPAEGGEAAPGDWRRNDWAQLSNDKTFEGFPAVSLAEPHSPIPELASLVPEQVEDRLAAEGGSDATWSPDGQWIAYVKDVGYPSSRIVVIPAPGVAGSPAQWPKGDHAATESDATWSPDGSLLAYSRVERGRFANIVIESRSGHQEKVSVPMRGSGASVVWSFGDIEWTADGRQLLFTAGFDSAIHTLDRDGTNLRRWIEGGVRQALSFDGSRLAYVVTDAEELGLRWRSMRGGVEMSVVDWPRGGGLEPFIHSLAWDPVTGRIVYGLGWITVQGQAEEIHLLNSIRPDGTDNRLLLPDQDEVFDPVWSPDARLLLAVDYDRLVLMRVDGTDLIRLGQPGLILSHEWSPDGQSILYSTEDGVFLMHVAPLIQAVYGF